MNTTRRAWDRWKRFASAAARAQGNVLFFLLYFIAIVPMGLLRLGDSDELKRRRAGQPIAWRPHSQAPADLDVARRQF